MTQKSFGVRSPLSWIWITYIITYSVAKDCLKTHEFRYFLSQTDLVGTQNTYQRKQLFSNGEMKTYIGHTSCHEQCDCLHGGHGFSLIGGESKMKCKLKNMFMSKKVVFFVWGLSSYSRIFHSYGDVSR